MSVGLEPPTLHRSVIHRNAGGGAPNTIRASSRLLQTGTILSIRIDTSTFATFARGFNKTNAIPQSSSLRSLEQGRDSDGREKLNARKVDD